MTDLNSILLFAGTLLVSFALLTLAWTVHRHTAAAAARELEAAERQRTAAEESLRVELLDRRQAVCAHLNALWLCWARCERPDDILIANAAAAAEDARTFFPVELAPDLEEVSALLVTWHRTLSLQRSAVERGRHEERVALLDQEVALEQSLKPKLAGMRILLIEATRPGGAV